MDTESTVDTETMIDSAQSADNGIFADISSAGEQEIEQRCLQDVGKYSNSFNAYIQLLLLHTYLGLLYRSEHRLRNARFIKDSKAVGLTRRQISVTC